ncbi:PLDc_N domain-containing protein [Bacillaceae bacterium Marseille-Q3522]|nr:PLDc_N domain-containing protein [Bacillaceae bacterium Marseille-Q3522]
MTNISLSLIAPLIVIYLLLTIFAIIDLIRRPAANGPKWIWALVIFCVSTVGPIIYFIFGRKEM